jgi:hypothetical protein
MECFDEEVDRDEVGAPAREIRRIDRMPSI